MVSMLIAVAVDEKTYQRIGICNLIMISSLTVDSLIYPSHVDYQQIDRIGLRIVNIMFIVILSK